MPSPLAEPGEMSRSAATRQRGHNDNLAAPGVLGTWLGSPHRPHSVALPPPPAGEDKEE